MRLSDATDTRLFLAGVAAVLALVAYLAVAFAKTHPLPFTYIPPSLATKAAPWTPHVAKFAAISLGKGRGYIVRVKPAEVPRKPVSYGGLIPTLVYQPPDGGRLAVGLWLRGAPGDVRVEIDEFRPGATSQYMVETTVPATRRWHHYTFRGRVRGDWLGLGMYVSRSTAARSWFAVRGLTIKLR